MNVESHKVSRHVTEVHGLPCLKVEIHDSDADVGPLRTRVEASFERIGSGVPEVGMIAVHVSTKVEKCMQRMEQTGKAGRALARKAAAVIESLAAGTPGHPAEAAGTCTRYGENRIRNCRKYDLGCGYRLITLQRGPCWLVPFMGSHDACQRWLANNSRRKEFDLGKGNRVCTENRCVRSENHNACNPRDAEEYVEEEIDLDLSDKQLRVVFSGLVSGLSRRS